VECSSSNLDVIAVAHFFLTCRWRIANWGISWISRSVTMLGHAWSSCTFHPSHYDDRSTRRSRWRAFCGRRIGSDQAAAPDPESFPTPFTQSASLRSRRRRLVCSAHAARPTDPFRNRIETVNSLEPSSSAEEPQVPATVLAQTAEKAGPKRTWLGSHCSGCRNEATESNVGLSAYRPTNRFGFRYSNQQGCGSADSRCSLPTRARLGWSFMAHFPRSHEGQPLEPRPLSMRIRNLANTLGFGRDGPIHAAHCWVWCSRRHRGRSGAMPDVQSSDSPAFMRRSIQGCRPMRRRRLA